MSYKKEGTGTDHYGGVITGKKFNHITILKESGNKTAAGVKKHICQCDCGRIYETVGSWVKCGYAKSCGCVGRKKTAKRNFKHGHTKGKWSPTYGPWSSMKMRCFNKKDKSYPNYGGRGITVCDRWLSFDNFLEDMGERPKGTSIDRINNNGNYEPLNCRWATDDQQRNNQRRSRILEWNGERMSMAQWEKKLGFPKRSLYNRLRRGWTIEAMFTKPLKVTKIK